LSQLIPNVSITQIAITTSAETPVAHNSISNNTLVSAANYSPAQHYSLLTDARGSYALAASDNDLTAAAYSGVFVWSGISLFNVSTQCDTSNCTWNPYATLAVRSQCANIIDQLAFTKSNDVLSWMIAARDSNTYALTTQMTVRPRQVTIRMEYLLLRGIYLNTLPVILVGTQMSIRTPASLRRCQTLWNLVESRVQTSCHKNLNSQQKILH
jgi:hypothetical protein